MDEKHTHLGKFHHQEQKIPQASTWEKPVSYKGSNIRAATDFSVATLEARRHKAMCLNLKKGISKLEVYIFPN